MTELVYERGGNGGLLGADWGDGCTGETVSDPMSAPQVECYRVKYRK